MSDTTLSAEDRRRLREELVATFGRPTPTILDDIELPRHAYPDDQENPARAWHHVIQQIGDGVQADFRPLIAEAVRLYPRNDVFTELLGRYEPLTDLRNGASEPLDRYGVRPHVQAFIQLASEEDRRMIRGELAGLRPTIRLVTNSTMLLEFDTDDTDAVLSGLEGMPGHVAWTVVPPGQPAYLVSHVFVLGPDGRQFRLRDTPASTRVEDIAASTLAEYPTAGGTRATVTDRVLPNGQGQRMRPDQTLHEAGVHDGEQFRVGYETQAGAVNPRVRSEALTRARNQLVQFAESRDWDLAANAPEGGTTYEVSFDQESIGPPPPPDGPVAVHEHSVQLVFGPDFPQSAPTVYWLTPIFHPNIYPNYDCPESRASEQLQGYVCLGELEEGYQPGLDLGELCLTLLDIAAFRNYSLQVPTGDVLRTAAGLVVTGTGNALDRRAAKWVRNHQDALEAIGGRRLVHGAADPRRRPYHHVVEPLDG